jgi:hypothetical protein
MDISARIGDKRVGWVKQYATEKNKQEQAYLNEVVILWDYALTSQHLEQVIISDCRRIVKRTGHSLIVRVVTSVGRRKINKLGHFCWSDAVGLLLTHIPEPPILIRPGLLQLRQFRDPWQRISIPDDSRTCSLS